MRSNLVAKMMCLESESSSGCLTERDEGPRGDDEVGSMLRRTSQACYSCVFNSSSATLVICVKVITASAAYDITIGICASDGYRSHRPENEDGRGWLQDGSALNDDVTTISAKLKPSNICDRPLLVQGSCYQPSP
jgi:hypothetical protein